MKKRATMIQYKDTKDYGIKISFPYDRKDIKRVQSLPGQKRGPGGEFWTCPLTLESAEKLQKWGWRMQPALVAYIQKTRFNLSEPDIPLIKIPGLGMDLFKYQNIGVQFIEEKDGNALVADEMGLGKTAQALAWCQLHPEKRPVVIIAPASLKLNWKREAEMWLPDPQVEILSGRKPGKVTGEIVIVNYDILPNDLEDYEKRVKNEIGEIEIQIKKREVKYTGWINYLIDLNPQIVIVDEVHYIKSGAAKRTRATKRIAKTAEHVICLSGTPIINRPIEFYNAIQLVDPSLFSNWWTFAHRYCGGKHNGFGWDFSGASNTEELHEKLTNSIMIRRKKEDVLKDLPDKIYSFLPMELSNPKEYYAAERNFVAFIKARSGAEAAERASHAEALVEIEGLKQLAVKGKIPQAVEWIQDVLETGEKLVVFATHKFVIKQLMTEFKKLAVKVDGSVSGKNRQLAVDKFQNEPETRLFIGNIKAAGVGITLTAASKVAFLEFPWSPGELSQAIDRLHRIGQKDSVNVYYLLAEETIEERIATLLDEKREVIEAVLDGKAPAEGSLLMELIDNYKE